ncbi:MAG TPA: aspartyl protease family protein [bacterium]|nr:aspartyl protease family protein [bacterium]
MGLTYIEAAVAGPKNGFLPVSFLVDSGASYTVLPQAVWKKLGLQPKRTMEFTLADGTKIKRKVSECLFRYGDQEAHTPVVLGESKDQAIAGTITLEIMGLVLNPFDRTLRPMKAMMMAIQGP